MVLQDHQTHLQNLVNQANTLSNEIETKRTLLLKVQGVIEYLSELGVKLLKHAPIPQGSSLEFMGGNKVVLEETDTVTVDSDTNNSIDAALTIMEIT